MLCSNGTHDILAYDQNIDKHYQMAHNFLPVRSRIFHTYTFLYCVQHYNRTAILVELKYFMTSMADISHRRCSGSIQHYIIPHLIRIFNTLVFRFFVEFKSTIN